LDKVTAGHVAVARVLGASGVRGALKVEPLAPKSVLAPGRKVVVERQAREIQDAQSSGKFLRLRLAGIEDREAAVSLRDRLLQVPEADLEPLPEGQYYRFQLIGLRVVGTGGETLGRVTNVLAAPENDVYVVQGDGGEALIPAVDDVVQKIDLERREITIEIIPGLLL
jgi:16S rRNA processing protein RimM